MIPELEHESGSWIVTRRATGEVIGEFYERSTLERIKHSEYLIETALQYLVRLNERGTER